MRCAVLITIMLAPFAAAVEAAPLSGMVQNPDGEPLAAVSLTTNVAGLGTSTDAAGAFTLECPGDVRWVTFSSVGYQPRQYPVDAVPARVVLAYEYSPGGDVVVRGDRAQPGLSPIAFTDYSRKDIARDYSIGEFPLLLQATPNLYTYTDGGGALGYSSVRIRGFDDKRIAASLNGVPLNDPEDQAAYFVDLPDFAANITDIQVQRGVGNALYGAASFGGSLNIVTGALSRDRRVTVTSGYGEYTSGGDRVSDLAKSSIEYVSGLIDGRWLFTGRFSDQRSGGYRRHSWYDGWSYYLSLARLDPRMTTELYLYGGPIRMHLAYYGVDRATLAVDRRANPLTYRNETDNFNQPHFHLHNTYQLSERATLATTLYYIQGEGYYEQLKQLEDPDDFAVYGLDPGELAVDQPRLVRQKWVDKRQWGWNPRLDLAHARGRHSIGGSAYYFTSDHWGQVVWVEGLEDRSYGPRQRYYRYEGRKVEANLFAQEYCRLTDRLAGEATAMLRYQRYDFDQTRMYSFRGFRYDVDWLFFSPRLGFTYTLAPEIALHTAFAVSSRTPTDEDIYEADDPFALPSLDIRSVSADSARWEFGDPTAKAERVYDFELGGGYRSDRYAVELALYWMEFRDEIIPEGAVDASGRRRTINADRSVHAGLELSGTARPTEALALSGNFAWAYNRIRDYTASLDLYDTDWNYAGQYRFDLADKTVPGFPAYLGNVLLDYRYRGLRAVWRHQFVGAQELDLANTDSLRIEPFQLASVSLSYRFSDFWHLGALTLTARVNNVFDRRYEAGGYGWNYAVAGDGGTDVLGGAEYFAAPERWYYGEVKLEIF